MSKLASLSVLRVFQHSTEASQVEPFGDLGLPLRYSNVFSSGAISPALAPASMVILHMVIRPSTERERTASPANSTTHPVPPAVPISPIIARIISFAVTPIGNSPSTVTLIFFALVWIIVWVASTCSTSDVPIPKARHPKAPWVAVWESPQTIVVPGRVKPCSGPITWQIPWRISCISYSSTPKSAQFWSSVSI